MSLIYRIALCILTAGQFLSYAIFGQENPVPFEKHPGSPPPASPVYQQPVPNLERQQLSVESTLYSIGEPTPEEQLYVELINRARANPPQEGIILSQLTDPFILAAYSYFSVDLNLMKQQFSLIQPTPPVAINANLTSVARIHSQDMLDQVYQGHNGSDGSTPGTRVLAAGYNYRFVGENVFASAESVPYGHAGFEVDWGNGTGGMQTPPGHRENIHNSDYREVGVGVIWGSKTSGSSEVGPQLVTQEFGLQQNATPFVTGVAYYDLNGNHFYDIGEGIGGVNVTVQSEPSSGLTAKSGGYAVPVSANANYTVIFSGPGFTPVTNQVAQGLHNVKLDFTPAYFPPAISGSPKPITNFNNHYVISTVGGARQYQWRQFQMNTPQQEGAEIGTNNVTILTTTNYNPISSTVFKSGAHSFHLVHPSPGKQVITLNPSYIPGTNSSSISFQSRLGYASSSQIASVQVSTDNGVNWATIYTQPGGGSVETVFTLKTVPLTSYAGQTIKIRFVYDFASGSYYPQTSDEAGWHFDDILFANTSQIGNEQAFVTAEPNFDFNPTGIANFALQARALTGHDYLPWGPITYVQSSAAPPELKLTGITQVANGSFDLTFDVAGTIPSSFLIQKRRTSNDPWGTAAAITAETVASGKYKVNVSGLARSSTTFFRIVAN
jgi:hypothetical protein